MSPRSMETSSKARLSSASRSGHPGQRDGRGEQHGQRALATGKVCPPEQRRHDQPPVVATRTGLLHLRPAMLEST
jgi:hypothetical protein